MAHSQSIAVRRTSTAVNDGTAFVARQRQLTVVPYCCGFVGPHPAFGASDSGGRQRWRLAISWQRPADASVCAGWATKVMAAA